MAVYLNKSSALPRYDNELVAIMRKDISIREADTKREPHQTHNRVCSPRNCSVCLNKLTFPSQ